MIRCTFFAFELDDPSITDSFPLAEPLIRTPVELGYKPDASSKMSASLISLQGI
jgi:hypothetical protein